MKMIRIFGAVALAACVSMPASAQVPPKSRFPAAGTPRPENVRPAGPYLIKLTQKRQQLLLTITEKDGTPVTTLSATALATAQIGANLETVAFEPSPVVAAGSKGVANQMVSMNSFSKPVIGKVPVNVTLTLAGRNPVSTQFPTKPPTE